MKTQEQENDWKYILVVILAIILILGFFGGFPPHNPDCNPEYSNMGDGC